jgi:hypothetical protein
VNDVYKMNYKAISLVFFFQIIASVLWYSSTPASFLGRALLDDVSQRPTIEMALLFAFFAFVYLLFIAWLLTKTQRMSFFGRFFLVFGLWACVFLPNFFFATLHMELDEFNSFYFLSYGLINTLLAALILPLWRSSRSIFKD